MQAFVDANDMKPMKRYISVHGAPVSLHVTISLVVETYPALRILGTSSIYTQVTNSVLRMFSAYIYVAIFLGGRLIHSLCIYSEYVGAGITSRPIKLKMLETCRHMPGAFSPQVHAYAST